MTGGLPQAQLSDGTLVVSGEVTTETVISLRKEGERLIRSAPGDLVVDLQGLVTAHSVVLSMLLCWQRLAAQTGIALTFKGVSGRLASLAALSNLHGQLAGFGPESVHPAH
ncbi:MAG: STAS domain-containing protein [Marinobacter sp.]|nr:STAS domain-containing protein [Marinobacter sp.]